MKQNSRGCKKPADHFEYISVTLRRVIETGSVYEGDVATLQQKWL